MKINRNTSLWLKLLLFIITYLIVLTVFVSKIDFSQEENDFIYLSEILKEQTKGIEDISERLRLMTDWLHENVKHGKYPPSFNGKGVANVVRGGIGNCGYQSCNIACFGEFLGQDKYRIIHNKPELGAPGLHTFAEINVDGNWIIYDPDNWQYLKNKNGDLIGIDEVIKDTSLVSNPAAAQWIYSSIKNKGYQTTLSWQKTALPYGKKAYWKFEKYGMAFIYYKELSGKWGKILLLSAFFFGVGLYLVNFLKKK